MIQSKILPLAHVVDEDGMQTFSVSSVSPFESTRGDIGVTKN